MLTLRDLDRDRLARQIDTRVDTELLTPDLLVDAYQAFRGPFADNRLFEHEWPLLHRDALPEHVQAQDSTQAPAVYPS